MSRAQKTCECNSPKNVHCAHSLPCQLERCLCFVFVISQIAEMDCMDEGTSTEIIEKYMAKVVEVKRFGRVVEFNEAWGGLRHPWRKAELLTNILRVGLRKALETDEIQLE